MNLSSCVRSDCLSEFEHHWEEIKCEIELYMLALVQLAGPDHDKLKLYEERREDL